MMMRELNKKEKLLYKRIAKILWQDWDPLGVYNEKNEWNDEYDGYISSVFRLAIENRDVYKISDHLSELQTISMGGISATLSDEHDKNIAKLIIKAKQEIINDA